MRVSYPHTYSDAVQQKVVARLVQHLGKENTSSFLATMAPKAEAVMVKLYQQQGEVRSPAWNLYWTR